MVQAAPIAFAPANGFPGASYRRFLDPLRRHHDVAAMPLPGHQPDQYPVDVGWQGLSCELEAFLEPLPRPVVGMGHSLGGVLMFMVARRRPEWFRSVVMLEPPLINGPAGVAFGLLRWLGYGDRITPAGQSRGRRDYWSDRDEARAYFQRRSLFRRFDADCLEDYMDAGLEPHDGGLRLVFRPEVEVTIFRTTPRNISCYPRLSVPGAVVNANESVAAFHKAGRRHVRRQGMRHECWPGGHLFPLEQPVDSAHRVEHLLKTLEGERR
jgi:pimeloyl-ACP methyl ester carboxylesterase